MDENIPKPFNDVSHPGVAPAAPSGRPVIVNAPQADPMMTAPVAAPAQPVVNTTPVPPQAPVATMSDVAPAPGPAAPKSLDLSALNEPVDIEEESAAPGSVVVPGEPSVNHVSKKPKKDRKVLLALVVLVVLGAGGGAGYIFWKKDQDNKKAAEIAAAQAAAADAAKAVEEEKKPEVFTSKKGGFSVNNLYSWKVLEADTTKNYAGNGGATDATYAKVEFSISDEQKLVFDVNPGGRGGECLPKATDVAFKAGNNCSSYMSVAFTPLPTANFPVARLAKNAKTVQLEKFDFMGDDDKKLTLVGITNNYIDDKGVETKKEINKPLMGLVLPSTLLAVDKGYIEFKIVDADGKPTQLSDANLKKVEDVLKTFTLTK